MVDLDDTIIEVHGYKKQEGPFGYFGGPRTQRAPRDDVDHLVSRGSLRPAATIRDHGDTGGDVRPRR